MALFSRKKKKIQNEESTSELLAVSPSLLNILLNGETITKEEALSIPAVASAVDTIAGTIASIPIKFYQRTEVNGKRKVDEIKDQRCNLINDDTKDTLDGYQFKRAIVTDYLLDKGGYAFINRVGNTVKSIHYVKSENITIRKNNDPIFKTFQIEVNNHLYRDYEFIKLLRNTKDGSTGESVREEISKALQTNYLNLIMQLSSAKKGGRKKGYLLTERALSKEVLDDLKVKWEQLYSNNDLNSIVLPQGAKFQESNDSTYEQQVNSTRQNLNAEIKDIFHIGDTTEKTFSNAIVPIINELECAINRVLLLEREKKANYYFAFDTKEFTKGDMKSRFEAYEKAIKNAIATPNECRYLENWDSVDGLDVFNFGLSAVLYDEKTKKFYVPNTSSLIDPTQAQAVQVQPNEQPKTESKEQEQSKEEEQAENETGN